MSGSNDWVSNPSGFNRPKIVSKRLKQSYNQGSPLGDPDNAKALESKMQEPENRFGGAMTLDDMINAMPGNHLQYTSNRIVNQIRDAQGILRQLPDIQLAANIVVSAIVKGGLQTTAVTIESDLEKTFGGLEVPLIENITAEVDEVFNFKKNLAKWVHDALMVEGAKVMAILPETSIDRTINSDIAVGNNAYDIGLARSHSRKFNLVGEGDPKLNDNPFGAGLNDAGIIGRSRDEGYNTLYQRFVDNPDVLKITELNKRVVADRFTEAYLEHATCFGGHLAPGNNSDDDAFATAIRDQVSNKVTLKKSYSNEKGYRHRPIEMIRDPSTLERPNIGRPVLYRLPMESAVPIVDPSDVTVHVAYLVALDENQRPVNRTSGSTNIVDEYNSLAQSNDLNSLFIRQIDQSMNMNSQNAITGADNVNQYLDFNQAFELYTAITWNDWKTRIENGVLGTSYNVAKVEDLMRLLFEMTLRKKRVQMLLIPASLMVYMAYNFDDAGVGQSLIEISKSIASLRMILMYSQVNMEFQASIPRRRLNIKIDPREPDQKAAVRMVYNNLLLNYQNQMPTNIIDPVSINQSIWRQAVEVNVESDPRYPQTKVDVEPIQFDKREPDNVLTTNLQKLHDMTFTLTPEQIDSSLGDERVTSRLLNNELFRERISTWKDITEHHLTDAVRKYCLHSATVMKLVQDTIESNKETIGKSIQGESRSVDVGRLAHNFVMGLTASLPSLDEEGTDDTEAKYEAYDKFLESVLNSQFSDEVYRSGNENVRIEDIQVLRNLIKADLVRQWLVRRGVVPEIGQWTGSNGAENIAVVIERSLGWLKSIAPTITSAVKQLRAINDGMGDEVPARGGEIAQENGNTNEGETMDGGFEDDFDFGDDAAPEDEEDEEPVAEEPNTSPDDDGDEDQ